MEPVPSPAKVTPVSGQTENQSSALRSEFAAQLDQCGTFDTATAVKQGDATGGYKRAGCQGKTPGRSRLM